MAKQEMVSHLGAMLGLVTPSSPSDVSVTLDASIGPPSAARALCSVAAELQVCDDADVAVTRRVYDLSLVIRFATRAVAVQSLNVEIVPAEPVPIARVFVRDEPDHVSPGLTATCPDLRRVVTSGTLTLNDATLSEPDSLRGRLELNLASGGSVNLEF